MNHRYSNKSYLTASQKVGRKTSRIGYSVVGDVNTLNANKMLVVKLGIREKYLWFCFAIDIALTKEKPYASLECCIHHFEHMDMEKFGIDFKTRRSSEKSVYDNYYQVGVNKFGNKWMEQYYNEYNSEFLEPISGEKGSLLIGFLPAIKLGVYSKQQIWLL